jgi:hypothetical protein
MYSQDLAELVLRERQRNVEQINRTWWKFEGTPLSSSRRAKRSHGEKR